MRILYVINVIQTGGAEIQMINLAKRITCMTSVELKIISLKDKGNLPDEMFIGLDSEIVYLGLDLKNLLSGIRKLISEIYVFKPQVIHSWMYHSNFILSLALICSKYRRNVIWSIHHNDLSIKNNKLSTVIVSKFSALLSHILNPVIVFVSTSSKQTHLRSGYRKKNATIIENALDQEYFSYQPNARKLIFTELGLSDNVILVGYFGRFDIIKNHQGFLHGMSMFFEKNPDSNVFVIMAGAGISTDNQQLVEILKSEGISERVKLLGIRTDMPTVYSSIDLCVSMSFNESFSLVLVEAMCCGTVCIASREADPLGILESGNILPDNTSDALCRFLTQYIYNYHETNHINKSILSKGSDRFDIRDQAKKYMALYKSRPLTVL